MLERKRIMIEQTETPLEDLCVVLNSFIQRLQDPDEPKTRRRALLIQTLRRSRTIAEQVISEETKVHNDTTAA